MCEKFTSQVGSLSNFFRISTKMAQKELADK
jgi:hypothetical protein